jgi:NADH dehydrogenase/NADH:ubiquinone oxidoreductase subunit G
MQMDNSDEKARANAKAIESEIQSISLGHWDWFKRQYKDFWTHARQISDLFKTLKPLTKEDRERLWNKFSSICEDVKRKQNSEYEDRKFKSEQRHNAIISEIERARPCTLFGLDPPDVDEMKALGQVLRKAGKMLSDCKSEMLGEHKQECFERIQEIRKIHDAWWESLKQHRSKKSDDYQIRIRNNLERNYERHRKATAALESCRRHADELRDKIASAWNEDWKDKAYTWLSETEDKIRDIEQSIERIENWIREDEEKLR